MRVWMSLLAAGIAGCALGPSASGTANPADAVTYSQPQIATVPGELSARENTPPTPKAPPRREVVVREVGPTQPGPQPTDRLQVVLDAPVGPPVSQVGERFVGHLGRAVVDATGRALLPAGAVVLGHVSDVRPDVITLALDEIDANGRAYPLDGRIIASSAGLVLGQRTATVAGPAMGGGAGTKIATGDKTLPGGTTFTVQLTRPIPGLEAWSVPAPPAPPALLPPNPPFPR